MLIQEKSEKIAKLLEKAEKNEKTYENAEKNVKNIEKAINMGFSLVNNNNSVISNNSNVTVNNNNNTNKTPSINNNNGNEEKLRSLFTIMRQNNPQIFFYILYKNFKDEMTNQTTKKTLQISMIKRYKYRYF